MSRASRAIHRAKAIIAAVAQFRIRAVRLWLSVGLFEFAMSRCSVGGKWDFQCFELCRR